MSSFGLTCTLVLILILHFCSSSLLDIAVSHNDTDDIEISILILKQSPQVFRLMIWSKNEDNPLHRSSDPIAVNLLHIVLLNGRHPVDSLGHSSQCLLLHLSSLVLSILT